MVYLFSGFSRRCCGARGELWRQRSECDRHFLNDQGVMLQCDTGWRRTVSVKTERLLVCATTGFLEVVKWIIVASGWPKKCSPASASWEIFNTIPFSTYWNCRQKLRVHVCVCLGRPCVSEQRQCVWARWSLVLLLLLCESFSASNAAKYNKQELLVVLSLGEEESLSVFISSCHRLKNTQTWLKLVKLN